MTCIDEKVSVEEGQMPCTLPQISGPVSDLLFFILLHQAWCSVCASSLLYVCVHMNVCVCV